MTAQIRTIEPKRTKQGQTYWLVRLEGNGHPGTVYLWDRKLARELRPGLRIEAEIEDGKFPRLTKATPLEEAGPEAPALDRDRRITRLAVLNTSVELLKAAKKPFGLKEVLTVARALERWALGEVGEEAG